MVLPAAAIPVPASIAEWFQHLEPQTLAEVVPDPAAGAVCSADMILGFCSSGNLASARVGALAQPVADLFERAYAFGIRHFLLVQDTHAPQTPEFAAFPAHCIRGTVESETIPELRRLSFADTFTVIEKNSLHPAIGTDFDQWLEAHPEVQTTIVVGNCTDLCVYQLAMHLRLRANALNLANFHVVVPVNAVDTYDLPEAVARDLPAMPHPGDFFHQVFLYHLAMNGVQVVRELC